MGTVECSLYAVFHTLTHCSYSASSLALPKMLLLLCLPCVSVSSSQYTFKDVLRRLFCYFPCFCSSALIFAVTLPWLWRMFDWFFLLFLCETTSTMVGFLPCVGIVCQLRGARHLALPLCLLACGRARCTAYVLVYFQQLPSPADRCCSFASTLVLKRTASLLSILFPSPVVRCCLAALALVVGNSSSLAPSRLLCSLHAELLAASLYDCFLSFGGLRARLLDTFPL